MLLEKPRQEIAPRNLDFFFHRVAGDLNDFHAVAERRWNVIHIVRRADEQRRRKVKGQIEVVIDEAIVLRRIEHLEHCRRRIAARTATRHLVDFVDHQDRIACLHPP